MDEDTCSKIEELFARCAAGVSRYVRLRVGSAELAEEITTRVFFAVVRNIHQQNGSLVGWLWTIVRTELARHFRQKLAEPYPETLAAPTVTPAQDCERTEEIGIIHAALQRLPDDAQQLIALKFFLGLSNLEIACVVNLTPSNVGVKLHRTLKELREFCE